MCGLDAIFTALAEERRRLVVRCLQEHDTLTLADLAELVAEKETGEDIATLSGTVVRDVYLSLYHHHVPPLEDAEIARYDQEQDVVAKTDELTTALDRARDSVDSLRQA